MKTKYIVGIIISSLSVLAGCTEYNACGNPTGCWTGYFKQTCCGTYVKSRCEKLCDLCTFSGPQCDACWDCVKHDGCGYCEIDD